MTSVSEVRVRYAETDQMGVAYHANYLVWCEVGRTDFIRALGMTYAAMEARGVMLAVAEAAVRFHASARYDELVRVETRLVGVQSRSVTFAYDLRRIAGPGGEPGERLASASTLLVSVAPGGRLVTLPTDVRALLERGLAAAD